MNQHNIIDISKYLDPELFRLGLSGFYPNRIKLSKLIKFIRFLIYFSTYAQLAAMINFVFSTTKITEIALIITLIITQLGFVGKLENFHYKLKKLEELDEIVSQEMFRNVTKREQKIFQLNSRNLQIVVNIYLTTCIFATLLYILPPLWLNIRVGGKHYPSAEKFPFNPDNYYFIVFFIQVTAYGGSVWNNGAMDCLFAKHAVIGTCMFKILCEKLKNVTNLLDSMNDDNNVTNRIRHCIIYHHEIIRYVSVIQNVFSYGTFVQFSSSALVICLIGFQLLVVSSEEVPIGLLIVYFSCMMFQLALYCWYGHMLMESSNAVTESCYSINWNEIEIKEQKMLIIIMERAKRPILLEAAGVFKLTLSTWITILKSSYSYFALLQYLYSK